MTMQSDLALVKLLLYPELWIFLALCVGCLISWGAYCPRSIRIMLLLLASMYYGLTTRPLAEALVGPLEEYYRPPVAIPIQQDAIVLFVNHPPALNPYAQRPTIVGTANAHLLLCGLLYVKAGTAPRVVVAEGAPTHFPKEVDGSGVLREWAELLGYQADAILREEHGRATYERARFLKQRLGMQNRIVLIDTAIHLRRSAAVFQKAGFNVTAVPCDYYNLSTRPWTLYDFVPVAANLQANNEAVYEYVGLLAYWFRGLI